MNESNVGKIQTCICLQRLCKNIFPEIKGLFYFQEDAEEWVNVKYIYRFDESEEMERSFNINITADSYAAMVDDVWNEIKRRFN